MTKMIRQAEELVDVNKWKTEAEWKEFWVQQYENHSKFMRVVVLIVCLPFWMVAVTFKQCYAVFEHAMSKGKL